MEKYSVDEIKKYLMSFVNTSMGYRELKRGAEIENKRLLLAYETIDDYKSNNSIARCVGRIFPTRQTVHMYAKCIRTHFDVGTCVTYYALVVDKFYLVYVDEVKHKYYVMDENDDRFYFDMNYGGKILFRIIHKI